MNQNKKILLVTAVTVIATASTAAMADLPAAVATTFTGVSANIQAMFDLAFPVVALGVGLFIVIKLFKRFGSKL